MKKWLVFLLCTLLTIAPCLTAHAAGSASVSSNSVYVGDTVKVTFTYKETTAVGSADLTVQFDNTHLEYKSYTDSLGGGGETLQGETITLTLFDKTGQSTNTTFTITFIFTAKAVGSATVKIINCSIYNQDFIPIDTSSASATVTVKAKQNLPSDCNLKSLTPPAGCTLSPKFSPNTTSYTCSVPYSVEKFPLDWELSDSKAKATPSGSVTLKVGTNTRSVRVTAQDGTTKTYTVTITRAADNTTPAPTPVVTAPPDIPVTVDGRNVTLSRTLRAALPDGFLQELFTYQDEEVESGVMGNLRVVQLNDGEEFDLYLYDETTDVFSLYHGLETTGETFTILDKEPAFLPAGSEQTSVNGLPCWTVPALGDGYYIVTALRHSTGKEAVAVYCTADGTLQTASSVLLGGTAAQPVSTNTPSNSARATGQPADGSVNWTVVNALVVVAALLLVGVLIAVIVLIRHGSSSPRQPRKRSHDWGLDNPYDITLSEDPETQDDRMPVNEEDLFHVYTGDDDFE